MDSWRLTPPSPSLSSFSHNLAPPEAEHLDFLCDPGFLSPSFSLVGWGT